MNAAVVIVLFLVILAFPTASRRLPRTFERSAAASPGGIAPAELVSDRSNFCNTHRLDAAFQGPDGKQYYFDTYSVFIVHKNNVTKKHRTDIFRNSPYFVDAMSYSPKTKKAYLYKNSKVWIYKYYVDRFIYKRTKKLKRPSPNIVDAAFWYQRNIYLLKDKYLYLWDEAKNEVKPNHVFSIRHFWKDVPSKIIAAMQYEDGHKTVLWKWEPVKNLRYYLFDNASKTIFKNGQFASFFPFCDYKRRGNN